MECLLVVAVALAVVATGGIAVRLMTGPDQKPAADDPDWWWRIK